MHPKELLEELATITFWQGFLIFWGIIILLNIIFAAALVTHYWRTEIKPHRNQPATTTKE